MSRQLSTSGGPAPEVKELLLVAYSAGLTRGEVAALIGVSKTALAGYAYDRKLPKNHSATVKETTKKIKRAIRAKRLPLDRMELVRDALDAGQ